MAIIGIFGYAGSGKDTVGKIIQHKLSHTEVNIKDILEEPLMHGWWLEEKSGWEIKKWAGKLKTVASLITGIDVEKFEDQEFKKTELGPEWNTIKKYESDAPWISEGGEAYEERMTVRDLLQKLGTEAMREGLHTNVWVNALMADYKPGPFYPEVSTEDHAKLPNWIITDTRFPNEAQAIKDKGGVVIKVDRPGVSAINTHTSETALDDWNFDYIIHNNGDINQLEEIVKEFINSPIFAKL
jgi:hypothetical protein